jgi:hypothetical protein
MWMPLNMEESAEFDLSSRVNLADTITNFPENKAAGIDTFPLLKSHLALVRSHLRDVSKGSFVAGISFVND